MTATLKPARDSEEGIEEQLRASIQSAYALPGTSNSLNLRLPPLPSPLVLEPRELSLYNGVSNRARGWKSKTFGQSGENKAPAHTTVKRWDGATKTWQPWHNVKRVCLSFRVPFSLPPIWYCDMLLTRAGSRRVQDPELWVRDSNCYVHLYGVGQSKRGPAFRVPFSALLEAKCHPLFDRFLVPLPAKHHQYYVQLQLQQQHHHQGPGLSDAHQSGNSPRFDLYMPAPPTVSKEQAFLFHIGTRNFFAWLLRKPLVGRDLGWAMITLLNTMTAFRFHTENNVADLLFYLDEMGYCDMRNQPHFALASLHLAEFFHIRDLYIDAFAHCTGMCDRLFLSPEYLVGTSLSQPCGLFGSIMSRYAYICITTGMGLMLLAHSRPSHPRPPTDKKEKKKKTRTTRISAAG